MKSRIQIGLLGMGALLLSVAGLLHYPGKTVGKAMSPGEMAKLFGGNATFCVEVGESRNICNELPFHCAEVFPGENPGDPCFLPVAKWAFNPQECHDEGWKECEDPQWTEVICEEQHHCETFLSLNGKLRCRIGTIQFIWIELYTDVEKCSYIPVGY